jgi:Fic family protein
MAKRYIDEAILAYLTHRGSEGKPTVGARELVEHLNEPRTTVTRHLVKLVDKGVLAREGTGPATAYRLAATADTKITTGQPFPADIKVPPEVGPAWGKAGRSLRVELEAPLGLRAPVSYQRQFVERYQPNQSSLLPADLAAALHEHGRLQGQQPAGTYARRVLEQLLIDLSWYSSRLEGNRKSLLDTGELFRKGRSPGDDADATMLLNHKDAIEFIVDAVPIYGITSQVVRNVQSTLMNGLLADPTALGTIRRTIVNISDTAYLPSQVPALLEEMLGAIVEKARAIRNPVECAFFLWVNIAYLQPFEDGNKRTSRLCSNLPLLLSNCAPLAFLNVEPADYAMAMLGVYEKQDVSLAVDLFDWTYRRSVVKYRAILESMGAPDPLRAKYREYLGDAIRQIVATGSALSAAVDTLAIPSADRAAFIALLRSELANLQPYNCARYRLTIDKTAEWVANGRTA